jgi:H+/Cl- antiporter ClcA
VNNYKVLTDEKLTKIPMLLKSILVGFAAGSVAVLFRLTLTYSEEFAFRMYDYVRSNARMTPIIIIGICLAGFFVGTLVSKNPMISGSGIPQVKGILMGYFKYSKGWAHTLCSKFIGGAVAILAGISLGREGPSIQLGACVAEGIGNKVGKSRLERRILMASGASAGLAAAFNAPLAGVIFALEEIFKYFSPMILLSTMSAAATADFVAKNIFGIKPIFQFDISTNIPLESYWILIILGIILGALGALYNYILIKTQNLYKKIKFLTVRTRVVIPFVTAVILGIAFPIVLGGGHRVIEELNLTKGMGFLLLIFAVKFLFSMISFGSGTPGGIFFPLLILGGTIGAVFGQFSIYYLGCDQSLFYNFIIIAMAGYFTAIVRAPITGVVLIMEMTGSFNHMLSLTLVAITAYIVAELLKSPPIYDSLLENLITKDQSEVEESSKKVMVEIIVQHGSMLENQQVKKIQWPLRTLLVSVKRGEKELLPKGDTELKVGDYLYLLTDTNSEWRTREGLEELNSIASIEE